MTHPQFVPPNSVPNPPSPAATESTGQAPIISAHVMSIPDESATPENGQAQAIIEEAQAVLEEAQADIEEARSDLVVADADLDEAQAELDEAEEELAVVAEATEDAIVDGYDDDDDFDEDFLDDDDLEQLRPGDVDESVIAVWDPEVAERYRDAFRDIQAHFVDEPEAALGEAQDLVAEAVQALADALLAEQVSLDPHEQDANPDTESMRIAMRGYRDFLERVLAL